MSILILDYGVGNVGSVVNAVQHLGYSARRCSSPYTSTSSTELFNDISVCIIPGVGSFPQAMDALKELRYDSLIRDLRSSRPVKFLGICLGMQLLMEWSEEGGTQTPGLGLFSGGVIKLSNADACVPHIGWTTNHRKMDTLPWMSSLENTFYFVHSYVCSNPDYVASTFQHGDVSCVSSLYNDNILGVQFHPEKSQAAGLRLLDGFFSAPLA